MKRTVFALICAVALSSPSWGTESNPYAITMPLNPHRYVIVGVTLGNNWTGFPDKLGTHYENASQYTRLDKEFQLYVSWIVDTDSQDYFPVTQLDPPVALSSFDWFSGHHDEFEVLPGGRDVSDVEYNACPDDGGLEAPTLDSYPLTSDGKLRVTDIHGGFANLTTIHLRRIFLDEEFFHVLIGWDKPGEKYDDFLGYDVNVEPGDVFNRAVTYYENPIGYIPVRVVEWVSTDFGVPGSQGPSPRYCDAADLAYWYNVCYSQFGYAVRWGWDSESPANSPNFNCDVSPWDGVIGQSDLARTMADLGHNSCQLSKAGADPEFAAILEWFGIAPTGRLVSDGPNGELPEYEVIDWAKNRRAVADPYGYRVTLNSAAAREIPWGLVKQMYR